MNYPDLTNPKCRTQACVNYLPKHLDTLEVLANTQTQTLAEKNRIMQLVTQYLQCPSCQKIYENILTLSENGLEMTGLQEYTGALRAPEITKYVPDTIGYLMPNQEGKILALRTNRK